MMSNLMAILLQHLCIKLGVVTGRDLAQACRDHYPRPMAWFLWVLAELAIAATDLAEVVGSAIGLQLLFGIPLIWGCLITSVDVLVVLYLQNRGFRYLEAIVLTLVATVGLCFVAELLFSKPELGSVLGGFIPSSGVLKDQAQLYVAIGIIGATVMPHNLYLHSSIVQTRKYRARRARPRRGRALRDHRLDGRADVRAVHQRRDPDRRGGDVPRARHGRGRRDPGGLPAAVAGARRRRRQHAVRDRAAGRRPELDAHGHALRPDRDGGLHQLPHAAVAAPPADAAHCHHPGRDRDRHLRRVSGRPTCWSPARSC